MLLGQGTTRVRARQLGAVAGRNVEAKTLLWGADSDDFSERMENREAKREAAKEATRRKEEAREAASLRASAAAEAQSQKCAQPPTLYARGDPLVAMATSGHQAATGNARSERVSECE